MGYICDDDTYMALLPRFLLFLPFPSLRGRSAQCAMLLLRLSPHHRRLPSLLPLPFFTSSASFHFDSPSLHCAQIPPPLALSAAVHNLDADVRPVVERKSKGQKKREALRGVDWALEFSTFSDSQLRRAIKWGDLQEEVFDAVKLVKRIGRDGKHARRRQLNLIGGMLRDVDPVLMAAIIKAVKDGDVDRIFKKLNISVDSCDEDLESEDVSTEEIASVQDASNDKVEQWIEGLLSGDSNINAEVYSIRSAHFDRQELRKLVKEATISRDEEKTEKRDGRFQDSKEKLRNYLESLIKLPNQY